MYVIAPIEWNIRIEPIELILVMYCKFYPVMAINTFIHGFLIYRVQDVQEQLIKALSTHYKEEYFQ